MQIGNHIFAQISFVTPVGVQESLAGRNEDGLLPTLLFQRVLISVEDTMLSSIRSEPTLSRLAGMGWVSPDRRFIDSSTLRVLDGYGLRGKL
jgi:hypothetical protein